MDGRNWTLFLQPYEQTVEELKVKFKTMRAELKMREAYAPIEFVTGRVKKISSVLEKAKRLNVAPDQLEQGIEDIAGIRIMCQFVDDIHRVASLIRSRHDLALVYEKDYITNYKDSGYRSYHMIIEYPVQTALGLKKVLAEIQIRTLAMNFWATIEHSLNYKYKESLPDEVKERLKKAAEAASLLDTEMSSIRQEIIDAQRDFEENSNVVSRVLTGIQHLYFYNRFREAAQFQLKFNELWEHEDVFGLKQLSDDIEQAIVRAKRGN
ncbi:putative GTP pyrophosphokinase [Paenibacillus cellulosilyticus]|uniref:GTP diphosphokinase n=1 Tax=Paenibacillus cellulosilyticus TaxID=375489 RepID=A0A2V2YTI3_9BACL|nr:GTP pyrophosphokinase family protein [Paenibacillus cellulosilyticus]PWV99637.1 putative GTP pyrophosphokinase [Paenibacillus cellulosilyticus]QKS44921.1 GTP pyrophosphokinase family protein [Paenibacillus cellulosilyticus]